MHQRLHFARHEAVVDEKIFFDAELGVVALKITGAVIFYAMTQDEVLRAGWSPDRIGLYETHLMQRAPQRGRRKKTVRDGEAAEVVDRDGHAEMFPRKNITSSLALR